MTFSLIDPSSGGREVELALLKDFAGRSSRSFSGSGSFGGEAIAATTRFEPVTWPASASHDVGWRSNIASIQEIQMNACGASAAVYGSKVRRCLV